MDQEEEFSDDEVMLLEQLFASLSAENDNDTKQQTKPKISKKNKAIVQEYQANENSIEIKFSVADRFSRSLLVEICRQYGFEPYRYEKQLESTLVILAPKSFIRKVLWPQYEDLNEKLIHKLSEATMEFLKEHA